MLGSVLNQVLLHQSVIGLETQAALDKYNIKPDIIIGCAGGGSTTARWMTISPPTRICRRAFPNFLLYKIHNNPCAPVSAGALFCKNFLKPIDKVGFWCYALFTYQLGEF